MATPSTDAPVTPLRQRMQQDMLMRGLGWHTQQDYIRHVRRFAAFLGRTRDTAISEDIRRFQLSQHENGVGPAMINGAVSALRFLFEVTLKRRDLARVLVITRYQRKLPDVLSVEEAGAGHQVQGRARCGLWRRPARLRGRPPQDRRYRQHPHADPG